MRFAGSTPARREISVLFPLRCGKSTEMGWIRDREEPRRGRCARAARGSLNIQTAGRENICGAYSGISELNINKMRRADCRTVVDSTEGSTVDHFMRAARILALVSLVAVASFGSTLTIDIVASIGPSPTSPNLRAYENNAETALQNGLTTEGAIGMPSYYSQVSGTINPLGFITTTYNSWLGTVNPGGTYSAETGNAVYFGLAVTDSGGTFDINDISFFLTGDGTIDLGTAGEGAQFDSNTVGFNGVTEYNSTFGSAAVDDSTALTSFYYSGLSSNTIATVPSQVAGIIASLESTGDVASYTVQGNTTQITFNVGSSSTPEPGTCAVLGLGLAAMAGLRRRFVSR